jgi:hypothetical protein
MSDGDLKDPASIRVLLPKRLVVDRLQAAGKFEAAWAALDDADLYRSERWNTRDAVFADDAAAIAPLQGIGTDPDEILALEVAMEAAAKAVFVVTVLFSVGAGKPVRIVPNQLVAFAEKADCDKVKQRWTAGIRAALPFASVAKCERMEMR